jgi:hypothetical protein
MVQKKDVREEILEGFVGSNVGYRRWSCDEWVPLSLWLQVGPPFGGSESGVLM